MQEQITNLKAVLAALDTLSLTGSKNCGTYYNCMGVLAKAIYELEAIQTEQEKMEDTTPAK